MTSNHDIDIDIEEQDGNEDAIDTGIPIVSKYEKVSESEFKRRELLFYSQAPTHYELAEDFRRAGGPISRGELLEMNISKRQVNWVKKQPVNHEFVYDAVGNNIDCFKCTGCTNCAGCSNCVDCDNCFECSGCDFCQSCEKCLYCDYCEACVRCTSCERCTFCISCVESISDRDVKGDSYYDNSMPLAENHEDTSEDHYPESYRYLDEWVIARIQENSEFCESTESLRVISGIEK